mgnify:CR=1 FL=1
MLKSIQSVKARQVFNSNLLEIMAIKIALYFEDVICDGGMWRSFVTKHKELYGKSLPFFPVDEEDYMADEPHEEDVAYLLWEAVMDWEEDKLVHPNDSYIHEIAKKFYGVLDAEFEDAPINERMQDFFREASFMDDFIEMREVLSWLWMNCYLTEGHHKFRVAEEMIDEVCDLLHFDHQDPRAIYAAYSQIVFRYKGGPLALYPAEWLAIVEDTYGNHVNSEILRKMEYRSYDIYLLEGFDEPVIHLRNTKGDALDINILAYGDMCIDTLQETDGCIASFVRYNEQWEPNGMDSWGNFKKVYEARKEHQERYVTGLPFNNYQNMMKESGGSPLFYFRNGKDVRKFVMEQVGIPERLMHPSNLDDKDLIVAYVPSANEGIAFAFGVANCIKDVRNPFYGIKYHDDDAMSLVTDENICDGAMLRYLIKHHMLPDASFSEDVNDEESLRLAQDNLDFLARTMRREKY